MQRTLFTIHGSLVRALAAVGLAAALAACANGTNKPFSSVFEEQTSVSSQRDLVASGQIPVREVTPSKPVEGQTLLDKQAVAALEKSQIWWVEGKLDDTVEIGDFTMVVTNVTATPFQGFTFALSSAICGKGATTMTISVATDEPVPAGEKAAFKLKIPVPKDSALRKGQNVCGTITQAW